MRQSGHQRSRCPISLFFRTVDIGQKRSSRLFEEIDPLMMIQNIVHFQSSHLVIIGSTCETRDELSFVLSSDSSQITAIKQDDVLAALQNLNIIRYQQRSDVLSISKDHFDSSQDKHRLRVDEKCRFWTPRITTKSSPHFQAR
jgi:hypothetical protein